ncbi:MAG TPA: hypothetical protein VGW37_13225 [Terriglobia bacterium]|nr:hypothetical protein [Terriglobia bacterium]
MSQYHLSASGMVNALAKVAERFELPMGIGWATGTALLAIWETIGATAQIPRSAKPVLDLAKPVPAGEQLTAMPGAQIGVIEGIGRVPRPYTLPLAVTLASIEPRQFGPLDRLSVEVDLANTGSTPFYLPASLKHATVLRQGNDGRRTFLFSLVLEDTKHGSKLSFGVGSSDGSKAVPGSFLRLEPGQAVRVLLHGGLDSVDQQQTFSKWIEEGVKEVRLSAEVSEWKYEDARYFIENEAQPVLSANALSLNLTAPN